jgi:putative spermidine/putrescine transport system ATP-binding protein
VAGFIGDNNRFNGTVESVTGAHCALRLPDGSLLTGVNPNGAHSGQTGVACIRPERIRLKPLDAPLQNGLRASVAGLIYFGDHVRVRCTTAKQDDCFVKLTLGDPALAGLAEGTQVALDIDPDRLRVFI